jgi:hypothetical protein
MSYNEFLYKLKKYQPFEVVAGLKICKMNDVNILNTCNNNKYDFQTDDNLKYEVKTDEMSIKTNNFFIEFLGYGKPSGIATTEAEFYIINDTSIYYLIETDKLKELVLNTRIFKTKDGKTSGHLLSRTVLEQNSFILK